MLNNITINERRATSFYKFGGVLIPGGQLQLLQDQHNPSLRGYSRVARQAPMPLCNVGSGEASLVREEGNMLALWKCENAARRGLRTVEEKRRDNFIFWSSSTSSQRLVPG